MKLKRILLVLLSVLLLSAGLTLCVGASSPRLDDGADLLTPAEEVALTEYLNELSETYDFDFIVVTTSTMGEKDVVAYADDYYDTHDYRKDGILLLIDMETRSYYESTAGEGISYFNEEDLADIEYYFTYDLSEGDYYQAFRTFAAEASGQVVRIRAMEEYEQMSFSEKLVYKLKNAPYAILTAVSSVIGLIGGGISTGKETSKLTSVLHRDDAADYVRAGSMDLKTVRDTYLYANVTRTRIDTGSSGRSGGSGGGHVGGSSHTSSGGVSHGGHGGHF